MKFLKVSVVIVMLLAAAGCVSLGLNAGFGHAPQGERAEQLARSPHYNDGQFHNELPTTMLTGDKGQLALLWEFVAGKRENLRPAGDLPYVTTDLAALETQEDVIVWLGHSSWYMQLAGKRILIDPVFSDYAAPFSFLNKAFGGKYPWRAEDMPEIDYLLISHDHYDHLDYATIQALNPKVGQFLTPLGVGAHLEHWGITPDKVREADWRQSWTLTNTLTVHVLPARHFSGRSLKRNQTLWASFLFETPARKIYYSGDSGYGPHFKAIGDRFGAIDIAIMENGQYDPGWQQIHMMPEETAQATADLNARAVIPSHAGRFVLANHAWDDPYRRLAAASKNYAFSLLTPRLGDVVYPAQKDQTFGAWWEE